MSTALALQVAYIQCVHVVGRIISALVMATASGSAYVSSPILPKSFGRFDYRSIAIMAITLAASSFERIFMTLD